MKSYLFIIISAIFTANMSFGSHAYAQIQEQTQIDFPANVELNSSKLEELLTQVKDVVEQIKPNKGTWSFKGASNIEATALFNTIRNKIIPVLKNETKENLTSHFYELQNYITKKLAYGVAKMEITAAKGVVGGLYLLEIELKKHYSEKELMGIGIFVMVFGMIGVQLGLIPVVVGFLAMAKLNQTVLTHSPAPVAEQLRSIEESFKLFLGEVEKSREEQLNRKLGQ